MTELKNLIQSFNNRLDQAEERIGELEDRAFEINQTEGDGGRMTRNEKLTGLLRHH